MLNFGASFRNRPREARPMKNPLDSLWGTVALGIVLTAILYFLARGMMGG